MKLAEVSRRSLLDRSTQKDEMEIGDVHCIFTRRTMVKQGKPNGTQALWAALRQTDQLGDQEKDRKTKSTNSWDTKNLKNPKEMTRKTTTHGLNQRALWSFPSSFDLIHCSAPIQFFLRCTSDGKCVLRLLQPRSDWHGNATSLLVLFIADETHPWRKCNMAEMKLRMRTSTTVETRLTRCTFCSLPMRQVTWVSSTWLRTRLAMRPSTTMVTSSTRWTTQRLSLLAVDFSNCQTRQEQSRLVSCLSGDNCCQRVPPVFGAYLWDGLVWLSLWISYIFVCSSHFPAFIRFPSPQITKYTIG